MTDDIDNPDAWDTDSAEHVTPRPSGMSVFSLRLPSPEFAALRAEAARRGMSMSELTRMALRTYLPSEGWECPKCGACYAPTVRECWHCRPAVSVTGTKDEGIMSMSRHIDLPRSTETVEDIPAGAFYPLRVAWEAALDRRLLCNFFSPEVNRRASDSVDAPLEVDAS